MALPYPNITQIPSDPANPPDALPSLWNVRYDEIDANFAELDGSIDDIITQIGGLGDALSDEITMADQVNTLVTYGAQRIYTERRLQVPEYAVTSAVSGDDSVDLDTTAGIEVDQHYYLVDGENAQMVRVKTVLSSVRIVLHSALAGSVSSAAILSRVAPQGYVTPLLSDMYRGGRLYVEGTGVLTAQGWDGAAWLELFKYADGGFEIPDKIDRLRVIGVMSRVMVITDLLPIGVTKGSTNVSPTDGELGLTTTPTLTGAAYYPLYGVPQARRQFQVIAVGGDWGTPTYDADETPAPGSTVVGHVVAVPLSADTSYLWRYRDETEEGELGLWSTPTEFSTAAAYVNTPTFLSPLDNDVDVLEQPVISLSAFAVTGGVDVHEATSIRIKDSLGSVVWELIESATLDLIPVPAGILQDGERVYTFEARHHGQTYGASAWSTPITITTIAEYLPDFEADIGDAYGGGYVAGKIVSDYDGETYGLVVSDGGGDSLQLGAAARAWMTSMDYVAGAFNIPPMTLSDGMANMTALRAEGISNFPAAKWIQDICNTLALNGYTDWYLPSRDELELIYRNFKPTADANAASARSNEAGWFGADGEIDGNNDYSVPAGTDYTAIGPAQTAFASFQSGGADAMGADNYASSTEAGETAFWEMDFTDGDQGVSLKSATSYHVRAVRRVRLS